MELPPTKMNSINQIKLISFQTNKIIEYDFDHSEIQGRETAP